MGCFSKLTALVATIASTIVATIVGGCRQPSMLLQTSVGPCCTCRIPNIPLHTTVVIALLN